MKLSNFASLDPAQRARGISGLTGCSQLDRKLWQEFNGDINTALERSEAALRRLFGAGVDDALEISAQHGVLIRQKKMLIAEAPEIGPLPHERGTVRNSCAELAFYDAVLNNYGEQCAVTRFAVRQLLEAVPILTFADDSRKRFALKNGLCLTKLHAAAFATGLMCFDDDLCVRFSSRLNGPDRSNPFVCRNFLEIEGRPLYLPKGAVAPSAECLAQHRTRVFVA
jgi:putative restriction endonuclease